MLFLDAFVVIVIILLVFFVALPLLQKAVLKLLNRPSSPIVGDLKDVESDVDSALLTKKQAEEVIRQAKKKAEDTLHKAEEISKKI